MIFKFKYQGLILWNKTIKFLPVGLCDWDDINYIKYCGMLNTGGVVFILPLT